MDNQVPAGSRISIRRSVAMPCELVSARSDEAVRYRATDLSGQGMWIQTAWPIRTGETVVVCFAPDDGLRREIMVFGEVARVHMARGATDETPGVGMGVEFLDLTEKEHRRLEAYLRTRRGPVPRRRRPTPKRPQRQACWR